MSAVYLAAYSLVLIGFLFKNAPLDFNHWMAMTQKIEFKVATILALFMLVFHAWIGIWTVSTDYIKCLVIRLSVQMAVALYLAGQLVWGMMMIWGY